MATKYRQNELKQSKLTAEGWVYLVILSFIAVGSILRNVNLLIVMTGMMVAPLILNWRTGVMRLRTLSIKRLTPNRVHAGQLVSIPWSCENSGHQMTAWNVVLHDEIRCKANAFGQRDTRKPQGLMNRLFGRITSKLKRLISRRHRSEDEFGRVRFLRIKPQDNELSAYRCFFPRRGEYETGPAEVSTSFPFGLVNSRIVNPATDSIFVAPAIGKLHPTWEQRVASIAIGDQSKNRRRGIEEDEFYALRKWRSGDSRKNIHWRSTAKFGMPMVKQFDQQNDRDFAMLLDLHSVDELTFQDCERILSFAATAILQMGSDVQGQIAVAICGRESLQVYGRNRRAVSDNIMRELATAEAGQDPEIIDSILELSNRVSKGTPIYCFSSRYLPEWLDDNLEFKGESDASFHQLAAAKENVRWIHVGSDQFRDLFSSEEIDNRMAVELAAKWTSEIEGE